MKRVITLIKIFTVLLLLNCINSVYAKPQNIHWNNVKKIVVLGDSLSDPHNFYTRFWGNAPKYPYYNGRFTNGKIWCDYLLNRLANNQNDIAWSTYKKYYFNDSFTGFKSVDTWSTTTIGDVVIENYALGSAYIKLFRRDPEILSIIPDTFFPSLNDEIEQYIKKNNLQGVQNIQSESQSKTLYIVWIGAMDFLNLFDYATASGKSLEEEAKNRHLVDDNQPNFGYSLAEKLKESLIDLIQNYKAAHIMLINLPHIGNTPYVHMQGSKSGDDMNKLIDLYNLHLAEIVDDLNQQHTNINITLVRSDEFMDHISSYNSNINQLDSACYTGDYTGSPKPVTLCQNESEYLFFDKVHPTPMVYKSFAEEYLMKNYPSF